MFDNNSTTHRFDFNAITTVGLRYGATELVIIIINENTHRCHYPGLIYSTYKDQFSAPSLKGWTIPKDLLLVRLAKTTTCGINNYYYNT
jgi:hypothetical protein